jgi:hypothetical protein
MNKNLPPGVVEISKARGPAQNTPVGPIGGVLKNGNVMGGGQGRAPIINQPHMPGQMMPPIPPLHVVPHDLRPRQHVRVHDTRVLSEAGMREDLSSYHVVRFEKASSEDLFDEEGYPVEKSWERASHIFQDDMDQGQAARRVRKLNKDGWSAVEKKTLLSSPMQLQINLARQDLEANERDAGRYHYVLAQLEWLDVKRHSSNKYHDKKSNQPVLYFGTSTRRTKSKHKSKHDHKHDHKHKRKYDVSSFTAYFKRVPRPEQDVVSLYQERQRSRQRSGMPPLPPPTMHPAGGFSHPHNGFQQPHQQPGPPGQPGSHQAPHPRGMQQPGHHQLTKLGKNGAVKVEGHGYAKEGAHAGGKKPVGKMKPMVVQQPPNGRNAGIYPVSPSSSGSSISDDSWASDSALTPTSSVVSDSHHKRGRNKSRGRDRSRNRSHSRGRARHRQRPEFYGLEAPRKHHKKGMGFAGHPQTHAASVPFPLTMGRHSDDGFFDRHQVVATRMAPRNSPGPLSVRHPGIRRIPSFNARQEILADDLERLELEDVLHTYKSERRARELREARMLEEEALTRDALLREEQEDARTRRLQRLRDDRWDNDFRRPLRAAEMYTYERDWDENPFRPLDRRHAVRRTVV